MLSDVAWDVTVEELVSNPSSGDESNNFEDIERKISDPPYFLYIGDRFELWASPNHWIFPMYASLTNDGTKQARVTDDVQTDMSTH